MSWRRHLVWILVLVFAGCTFGPKATTGPTPPRSTVDALRMVVEGSLPLEAINIHYEIGNEAWQGRTVLDVAGSGSVQVSFDHAGQHNEWSAELNKEKVLALCQLLVDHQVWDIEGRRETGVPDEAYPVITVQVEGLEPLTVGMWHNEALEHTEFRAIMGELAGLALDASDGQAR